MNTIRLLLVTASLLIGAAVHAAGLLENGKQCASGEPVGTKAIADAHALCKSTRCMKGPTDNYTSNPAWYCGDIKDHCTVPGSKVGLKDGQTWCDPQTKWKYKCVDPNYGRSPRHLDYIGGCNAVTSTLGRCNRSAAVCDLREPNGCGAGDSCSNQTTVPIYRN